MGNWQCFFCRDFSYTKATSAASCSLFWRNLMHCPDKQYDTGNAVVYSQIHSGKGDAVCDGVGDYERVYSCVRVNICRKISLKREPKQCLKSPMLCNDGKNIITIFCTFTSPKPATFSPFCQIHYNKKLHFFRKLR